MKKHTKMTAMVALVSLLVMILSGCSSEQKDTVTVPEPIMTAVPADPAVPAELPATEQGTGMLDGERFEDVIMLEGMEETVRYEHVRNDGIGIEMDYDYEQFIRKSESGREFFVSRYDSPENPVNYLEVTYSAESAESVAAAVSTALSQDYAVNPATCTLGKTGNCIRIDASSTPDGQTPDLLQLVYIVPAGQGCVVAIAHYSFEGADGFGTRIAKMMDSLVIIGKNN